MPKFPLATPRLMLREWQEADVAPFHVMCRDPRVMRFVGPDLTRRQAAGEIARYRREQQRDGHSFRALEHRGTGRFIGFCGIRRGSPGTPLAGQPELGWRIVTRLWGQGYACEAAVAAINWAFGNLQEDRLMAMTSPNNSRSWGLMLRLGMKHRPELDFGHSRRTGAAVHRPHIVFTVDRNAWRAA